MKKEFRSYNVKTIETPTTIEVWEYLDEPVFYSVNVGDKVSSKYENADEEQDLNDTVDISACEYYDALKRKQKHYEEMRWVIARIVDCNFDDNTKFMTLTFKENIQDIIYTNYEFNKFIKRLNFHLYHVKKQYLKYLAVWEKQKRGAIHYHIIFFDFLFIKINKLQEIWGHGFVKINKIDVDSKDNRGRYVSKYFSKDVDDKTYKQKSFFKSQNLLIPITKRMTQYESSDFSNENVVFSKTYSRKVPDFYNPSNTGMGIFYLKQVRLSIRGLERKDIMIMITKSELQTLGFGTSQASDIIRKAKRLMVNKGFGYYDNRRLGRVPVEAVEQILGTELVFIKNGVFANA